MFIIIFSSFHLSHFFLRILILLLNRPPGRCQYLSMSKARSKNTSQSKRIVNILKKGLNSCMHCCYYFSIFLHDRVKTIFRKRIPKWQTYLFSRKFHKNVHIYRLIFILIVHFEIIYYVQYILSEHITVQTASTCITNRQYKFSCTTKSIF